MVWTAPAVDPRLLIALGLILVELALVTAVALLFSTYSSPLLSAAFTVACGWLASSSGTCAHSSTLGVSGAARWVGWGVSWVLPNLALFDVKAEVVHGIAVPAGQVLAAVAYGAVYSTALLVLAIAIFEKRDLK